jgi:prophage DNA circulation protein
MSLSSADYAAASAVCAQWVAQYEAAAQDATRLLGLVSELSAPPDTTFGRYVAGGNQGFLAGNAGPYSADTTVDQLVAQGAAELAAVTAAAEAAQAAVDDMGSTGSFAGAATGAQALAAALLAACADPADAVRLFAGLAAFQATGLSAATTAGGAVQSLFAATTVVALAQAAQTYQPSSQTDAQSVLEQVTGLLDAQIMAAGNTFQDALFTALRALRVATVQDLQARGANLAPIVTVTEAANLPSLVISQQLYRDATRANQLEIQANPVHPLFMPTSFPALAS